MNMRKIIFILAALALTAGCVSVDKTKIFEPLGQPEDITFNGSRADDVFNAVVKVTRQYFDADTEDRSGGVVYTYFTKNAHENVFADSAETYLRKCIAVIEPIDENVTMLRLQVAAFRLENGKPVPTGSRDQAVHEAVKYEIEDELSK